MTFIHLKPAGKQKMKVDVTLRYLKKSLVEIKTTEEVDETCTAGELCNRIVSDHAKAEGINFTGANIAVLVNGRLAAGEMLLHDGDDIKIMPVAAGG